MKKLLSVCLILILAFGFFPQSGYAENTAEHGDISGKTVIGGLASLIIWPG